MFDDLAVVIGSDIWNQDICNYKIFEKEFELSDDSFTG